MIAAAEALIRERGDDFTLGDVTKHGKVSISSIYNLFDSKDALIQVVHADAMNRMIERHAEMVAKARPARPGLVFFIPALVDQVAELMLSEAEIMRPLLLRAAYDPVVAEHGRRAYADFADTLRQAILAHRSEITHADPDRAADSSVRIIYAALARHLGYGSSPHAVGQGDWSELKSDLGDMCAAFLTRSR